MDCYLNHTLLNPGESDPITCPWSHVSFFLFKTTNAFSSTFFLPSPYLANCFTKPPKREEGISDLVAGLLRLPTLNGYWLDELLAITGEHRPAERTRNLACVPVRRPAHDHSEMDRLATKLQQLGAELTLLLDLDRFDQKRDKEIVYIIRDQLRLLRDLGFELLETINRLDSPGDQVVGD